MTRIVHLIDDTQPGGVMRYLEFLARDAGLAGLASHAVVPVPRKAPYAVHVEGDLIVSHLTVSWGGLAGLMTLRALHAGTPMVHVEHSYCAGFAAANVRAPRRFQTLLRCAYALFDRVVAVSEGQADWLRTRRLVDTDALRVIRPCVDLSGFRNLPAPARIRTIGAIGRFDRQKGFDLLIRAFRAVPDPDLRLQMIGDGEEAAALVALAEGDSRITFPGFAPDPVAAMAGCDAIAMPSRWEPYGIVALESLAAGRPLLVSRADGLRDHATNGAIAVPDMSVECWSDALAHVAAGVTPPSRGTSAEATLRLGWTALLDELVFDAEPLAA
ncbi:glycosyltransferase family 4 protein [Sulfitobacter sp. D35]|uniref:glycosyltransferase family 4 protein n=1 Tax=Sulfitobacter sp. D35 TaxID=3083252 RepID=UPI00296EE9FA|nr:glycosyltransferase family 4 protein [Sulfitobacter sp. D35]MDW4498538.1 glycosyltransferase family 4 protein [Sulfitobacter sp. D35]